MSEKEIDQEIQTKCKTAARVTRVDVEANIVECHYINIGKAVEAQLVGRDVCAHAHPSLYLLTTCVLVLRNGFTVTGQSSCVFPENFDAEIARKLAREDAVQKMWPLIGYELRSKLAVDK